MKIPLLRKVHVFISKKYWYCYFQANEGNINYLTYDQSQNQLDGNAQEPITAIQHQFCETAVILHEDFLTRPKLTDVKLRYVIIKTDIPWMSCLTKQ